MATHQIPADSFTQRLHEIRAQIAAGQLAQAAQALNDAQREQPRDPRLALLGMRLAEQAGNLPGAVRAAQHAVGLLPDWHVALIELARVQSQVGEFKAALENARRAVAQAPMDAAVLEMAAGIALAAKDPASALPWLQNLVDHHPERADWRARLARALLDVGQTAEARTQYRQLLDDQPADDDALLGLVNCALDLNETDNAQQLADALLARRPESSAVQYVHALAHGKTPPSQPGDMIERLFSGPAARDFDVHLVRGLKYEAPKLAAEHLLKLHPQRNFNLLDLGCGTGLMGVYLGRLNGHIIGVDLSPDMIAQAARHNIYSRFHQVNMLDALRDTPADHYEAITCLDTLVYVGDLTPVIPNALRILKAGGHFLFTCEAAGEHEDDLVLRETTRYAHKASHVERLCREAGFDDVQIHHLDTLRMEAGKPLPGFLAIARKPAAS